jgi:tetratricopeptide (TPR) repeat protein
MTVTGDADLESDGPQLYTPAMMAGLLKIPVRNIRRWHRMGLLESSKVAHRLPYFSFIQVQNAKQLAAWIARGARPADIKRTLTEFGPRIENRSLTELNLVIDGRRLLLRDEGKLLSSTGQLHLDFDSDIHVRADGSEGEERVAVLSLPSAEERPSHAKQTHAPKYDEAQEWTRDELLQMAEELEDEGQLHQATEWYRVILAKYGLSPEICFQLAEVLYRCGDNSAARERYYNAIELDEDFIEARANLGCVLAETGQTDLAIAAFQGALAKDDHYPDVHYHLARCLDEVGQNEVAVQHWTRFLQLSPQSPWADEALDRLGRL